MQDFFDRLTFCSTKRARFVEKHILNAEHLNPTSDLRNRFYFQTSIALFNSQPLASRSYLSATPEAIQDYQNLNKCIGHKSLEVGMEMALGTEYRIVLIDGVKGQTVHIPNRSSNII